MFTRNGGDSSAEKSKKRNRPLFFDFRKMISMRIGVMGIGGVGGYFGGKLARYYAHRSDVEVVFIARGNHLRAIQEKGLRLITAEEGTFTTMPHKATDSPFECGIFDLVLFCVKTYDLEESARLLEQNVDEKTAVITLLNGVDNAKRLKMVLPQARVLNGSVYIGAHILSPGVVQQVGGSCKLFFGSEDEKCDDCQTIERVLRDAGIKAEYREDIERVVWEKYLFISPLASATTYLGKNFGELMEDEEGRKLLDELLSEVELLARVQGVMLPENIHKISIEKISSFPSHTKSSMQIDFERGKKAELETLTGYVVKSARNHGIPAPLHEQVYHDLLKRLAP